jgi:menaquinone-dependent protoporphyrinogen oxidase
VFAGRLDYARYGVLDRLVIRLIMRMTGGPTRTDTVVEYTDWQRVEAFGRALSSDLASPGLADAVPSTFRGGGALRA